MSDSIGITHTQHAQLDLGGEPFRFTSGETLDEISLAYEAYGELNADRSNAVLLFHALSGTHHAAGFTDHVDGTDDRWTAELHAGWWDSFIGPGRALDTNHFHVICVNLLGGCYGSTGPASIDPNTGKPYGATFPEVSVNDVVRSQALLLDQLGIEKLHAAIGPSVGGLCALTFANLFPERVQCVVPIASGFRTTVLNRLILFEQVLAIENDPHFAGGAYYDGPPPTYGLALARMISHKTFVHLDAIERRARKNVDQPEGRLAWYKIHDKVESYILHQGTKFVERFDANTYLRICQMWSRYNACAEASIDDPVELFAGSREHGHRFLVFSIDSDFCFYPEEQSELAAHLKDADVSNIHITVHSDKGHDSFLLEPELYTPHLDHLLKGNGFS
jgi:homoserine O-acetyltransferase